MIKKEKPILLKAFALIFLFLAIEVAAAFYFFVPKQISGFSIADVTEVYSGIKAPSKIFLITQAAIILLIIFIVSIKNRHIKKRNTEKSGIDMQKIIGASKTSLDALYTILQMKKHLRIKSIAGLFEIKEDLAMEWARILESGSLARIEYPGFGGPVLVVIEKKKPITPPPIRKNKKAIKPQVKPDQLPTKKIIPQTNPTQLPTKKVIPQIKPMVIAKTKPIKPIKPKKTKPKKTKKPKSKKTRPKKKKK